MALMSQAKGGAPLAAHTDKIPGIAPMHREDGRRKWGRFNGDAAKPNVERSGRDRRLLINSLKTLSDVVPQWDARSGRSQEAPLALDQMPERPC
jgi:hypothetical protein